MARAVSPVGEVLAGPFAGLRLPVTGTWGGQAARLAGTYEEEIADVIEAAIARRPKLVIDAGAAEGYYAVGLALRLPEASVVAFELDPASRRACRATARRNGARNVRVRGRVTRRALARELAPGALVMCDVEGYEASLLDPARCPQLSTAHVVVELHEFAVPGVTQSLLGRFAGSHRVDLVTARGRDHRAAQLAHLDERTARAAVAEGRPESPPMQWAIMSPLAPARS